MFVLLGVSVCVDLFNFPSNFVDIRVKFSCQAHFVCIGGTSTPASKSMGSSRRSQQQQSNYQIPASALYEAAEEPKGSLSTSSGRAGNSTLSVYNGCIWKFISIFNPREKQICSLSSFKNRSCLSTLEMFALDESQLNGVCRLYRIRSFEC